MEWYENLFGGSAGSPGIGGLLGGSFNNSDDTGGNAGWLDPWKAKWGLLGDGFPNNNQDVPGGFMGRLGNGLTKPNTLGLLGASAALLGARDNTTMGQALAQGLGGGLAGYAIGRAFNPSRKMPEPQYVGRPQGWRPPLL